MPATPLLPILLIALSGAATAAQPAFKGQLAGHLGSPLRAALVSFSAGAGLLLLLNVFVVGRANLPDGAALKAIPAHLWVAGGFLGAFFVTSATYAAPKIGAGALFSTLIAAQLIAALALDHFGLLGLEEKPASLVRMLGVLLLIAGAALVVRA